MSILEYMQERDSKNSFAETQGRAEKMFNAQKEALKGIADTTGFKEIVSFWEREKESAIQRNMTAKKEDATAKAMYQLADRFLKYLSARL